MVEDIPDGRDLSLSLSAKNKLGFIDGSSPTPDVADTSFKLWNRCNGMVISWLLNSLSKDIADSVLYSRTTKDLWNDLDQPSGAKL
uniref:Reverse transcriptase n=1 Tax=Solanum tuberosum TaxID=4113 RepID=M1B089_SOLTU